MKREKERSTEREKGRAEEGDVGRRHRRLWRSDGGAWRRRRQCSGSGSDSRGWLGSVSNRWFGVEVWFGSVSDFMFSKSTISIRV
ncbi:hypothetical protein Hdeb2414_s0004g00136291 [Helianthus debilis subsp. tardiflorus]